MRFLSRALRLGLRREDQEEAHTGDEHRLEIEAALRQEKVHVGEPHLRRCHGLSVGRGRALLL